MSVAQVNVQTTTKSSPSLNGNSTHTNEVPYKGSKTFVKVVRGVAQGAPTQAKVEAEKLFQKENTQRSSPPLHVKKAEQAPVLEDATNVAEEETTEIVEAVPSHLYRAEQIAERLGTSVSHIYARIAKDKPKVYAMYGRAYLYNEEYVRQLENTPRRMRQRRVQPIAPHETAIAKAAMQAASAVKATTLPPVSPTALTLSEIHDVQHGNTKSLMARMAELEQKVAVLESLLGV